MPIGLIHQIRRQIADLLKELRIIDHADDHSINRTGNDVAENRECTDRNGRRQEIRRELVRIVNLQEWRQAFPNMFNPQVTMSKCTNCGEPIVASPKLSALGGAERAHHCLKRA